ncbi:MerR family transcriptional regulator [Planctomicrobium piriforme]|uniref:Methanogenic corrinoid protein MtbC1 n=1 Tax=Planctomicrobium piriforme TaxID=1576369 RepID=A0A1I3S7R1_9PLAN|nr:B12-binding domain-containing protein [Planctomicrobium piriforme]SFJ54873.1 Methanogenic corrinoid protein MtbC1 [Planctomicrobium piriforme]
MKDLVTPRQVAQAIDMSESSLKRWCDQGLIPTVRTAGGHRRLPVNGVLTFLRNSGYQLVKPELLGLPPSTLGGRERKLNGERDRLFGALVQGDEQVCVEVVLNLYLAGIAMSTICDEVLAPVFTGIGEKWGCGDIAVYQERRSCEICHRVLHEVRRALPELPTTAPIAVGGTVDGDPYTLASSMVELVLRENGWRACSLGNMLPFLSLRQALCDMRPRLFWLSVSSVRSEPDFLNEFDQLTGLAQQNQVSIVVGGKALTPELRCRMQYSSYCDTLKHLESFAQQLVPTAPARSAASLPEPPEAD